MDSKYDNSFVNVRRSKLQKCWTNNCETIGNKEKERMKTKMEKEVKACLRIKIFKL